jgi:hypothetical protein
VASVKDDEEQVISWVVWERIKEIELGQQEITEDDIARDREQRLEGTARNIWTKARKELIGWLVQIG